MKESGFPASLGTLSTIRNHQPASSNTAAIITVAAATLDYHIVDWIGWSYDGVPTGGKLTITIDGTEVFDLDITTDGPGQFIFPPAGFYDPTRDPNEALVITLAAGGSGVTGKLAASTR